MAYEIDPNLKKMREQYFQSRRAEARGAVGASMQGGEDAITRRFASMGSSGSGAQIAALQKNREAAQAAERQGLADVNAQELQQESAINEAEAARSFQGHLAGQDLGFRRDVFGAEQGNKLKELDLAQKQFDIDKATTEFNKRLALREAGLPSDDVSLDALRQQIMAEFQKQYRTQAEAAAQQQNAVLSRRVGGR